MGLRREVVAERTATLLAEGRDTVELVSQLTAEVLQELGFKAGDLKKVAANFQGLSQHPSHTLHGAPAAAAPQRVIASHSTATHASHPVALRSRQQASHAEQKPVAGAAQATAAEAPDSSAATVAGRQHSARAAQRERRQGAAPQAQHAAAVRSSGLPANPPGTAPASRRCSRRRRALAQQRPSFAPAGEFDLSSNCSDCGLCP